MDPSYHMHIRQRAAQRRRAMLILLGGLFAVLALVTWQILVAAGISLFPGGYGSSSIPVYKPVHIVAVTPQTAPEKLTVSDKTVLEPLSSTDAARTNLSIPIAKQPNPAARSLIIPYGNPVSWSRSVDCLTAAIYYEARNEPADGQRAVAQVILNRVRHPAFPHTVCGVVFQGSERKTGCQFSFTCDGSLARLPQRAGWQSARIIAAAALAGSVFRPVGWATHYHADYVVPYWAFSLAKTGPVGRHIFYRWPGSWGTPGAFSAHYAGSEPVANWLVAQAGLAIADSDADASAMVENGIVAPIARPVIEMSAHSPAPADRVDPAQPGGSRWILRGPGILAGEK